MALWGFAVWAYHFQALAAGRPGFENLRAVLVSRHWLLYNEESTRWVFSDRRLATVAFFFGLGHMLQGPLL